MVPLDSPDHRPDATCTHSPCPSDPHCPGPLAGDEGDDVSRAHTWSHPVLKGRGLPILVTAAVAMSAIVTKELQVRRGGAGPALMADVSRVPLDGAMTRWKQQTTGLLAPVTAQASLEGPASQTGDAAAASIAPASDSKPALVPEEAFVPDPALRWFDGRPVRPERVLWMTVTAYSPDWRSCGDSADGRTATMHCVSTNGTLLVAADPSILAYGSMLTVPGYGVADGLSRNMLGDPSVLRRKTGEEPIVPVLDCGGAIKGKRLDVLFATHEEALRWGVRFLPVTVWRYVDDAPSPNPRRLRRGVLVDTVAAHTSSPGAVATAE